MLTVDDRWRVVCLHCPEVGPLSWIFYGTCRRPLDRHPSSNPHPHPSCNAERQKLTSVWRRTQHVENVAICLTRGLLWGTQEPRLRACPRSVYFIGVHFILHLVKYSSFFVKLLLWFHGWINCYCHLFSLGLYYAFQYSIVLSHSLVWW